MQHNVTLGHAFGTTPGGTTGWPILALSPTPKKKKIKKEKKEFLFAMV